MTTQYFIKKEAKGAHVEPKVFSLPFSYNNTSFGVNVSFDELKQAGFVKYVKADMSVPPLKILDHIEFEEINENEGTFKAIIRDMNAEEEKNFFGSEPDLNTWKTVYIKVFNEVANKAYKEYLSNYPELEQSTFSQKANEAFRVMANQDLELTDTPFLSSLVKNDKEKRNQLARDVQNKVLYITTLESFCVEKRDAIKACNSIEEIKNITLDLSDLVIG